MRKLIISIIFIVLFFNFKNNAYSKALIGEISKEDFKLSRPQVIDAISREPISGARISIPAENKFDITDNNGYFKLSASKDSPVILSVQKSGYKPYSLTLQNGKLPTNLMIALEKNSPFSVVVSDNLLHLGDNSFSEKSAGACLINAPCMGPEFTKKFTITNIGKNTRVYIIIGSIIGIDTLQAMKLKQNNLSSATSSPVEVFVNKTKIAEIKINGDNQKIPVPVKLLKAENTLSIKTGVNLNNDDYTDYDDIELMNLIVDIKN